MKSSIITSSVERRPDVAALPLWSLLAHFVDGSG